MQLKRYEAPTVNDAFRRIKAELGSNAVIFSTRTIDSPKNPYSRGNRVEVIAAVERCGGNDLQSPEKDCIMEKSPVAGEPSYIHGRFCVEGPANKPPDVKINRQSPAVFESCFKDLVRAGFQESTAWFLIGQASSEYKRAKNAISLKAILVKKIAEYLPASAPLRITAGSRKAIALIGPTGVGKTTTLAKIAAQFSLTKKARVKIVTLDTYRIAAVEQLRVYGKIMSIPVVVAASPEELSAQINAGDADLILLDTAGINYKSKDSIHDLSRIFSHLPQVESHLVLSTTSSDIVLKGALRHFSEARVDRLILSKVDECFLFGSIYDFVRSADIPVSYITTGQRVPEDLEQASAYTLARMFLKGYN